MRIQNQSGNDPNKWDKTGVVVEVKQHDQYVIRVDGSGRVTLRNRKFLRKFQLYKPFDHCPDATQQLLTNSKQAVPPQWTAIVPARESSSIQPVLSHTIDRVIPVLQRTPPEPPVNPSLTDEGTVAAPSSLHASPERQHDGTAGKMILSETVNEPIIPGCDSAPLQPDSTSCTVNVLILASNMHKYTSCQYTWWLADQLVSCFICG